MSPRKPSDENGGARRKPRRRKSVSGKPASDKPASDKLTSDTPTSDKTAFDESTSDTPTSDKPVSDKPASDKPVSDTPDASKSATEKPASRQSASDKRTSRKSMGGKRVAGKSAPRKRAAGKSAPRKRTAGKSASRKRADEKSTPPPVIIQPPPPEPTLFTPKDKEQSLFTPQEKTLPFPPATKLSPSSDETESYDVPPTVSEPESKPSVSMERQCLLDDRTIPETPGEPVAPGEPVTPDDRIVIERPYPSAPGKPTSRWQHLIQHSYHSLQRGFSQVYYWVYPRAASEFDIRLPHTHREAWLLHPAAVLLGLAAGWQWAGMKMAIGALLDPLPATVTMIGAIALLMAAVGPRIPGRIVLGFVRIFGRRWYSRGTGDSDSSSDTFWMLQAVRDRDESLLWLSLAVLCSAAGAVTLLTILLGILANQFYHYLLEHFFWTSMTLAGLEWAIVILWMGGAWLMNGLAVAALASAAAARTESRRSPPGIAAGLLLGLGIAWLLHELWTDGGMSGTQILMLGVLPMFSLSVFAAWLSQRAEQRQVKGTASEADAPELSGQGEGWIWLALLVWGIGSVLAGSGWLTCRWVLGSGSLGTLGGLSGYLLVLGSGVALASFHARHRKQSVSGCGMALWAAGVAVGTSATMAAFWPAGEVGGLLQMAVLALPVGYALHYAERAWLARVGSETLGFAQMTTALLSGCAISLIAAHWWVQPALGPMGTMAVGALVMLAYGGLVQIYEGSNAVHIQRLRLGLVFASLTAAIVLFPAGAAYWGSSARAAAGTGPLHVVSFESADLVGARRICLIGLSPQTDIPTLEDYTGEVDLLTFTPHDQTAAPTLSSARTHALTTDGFRALRLEHRVYGLIYQCGPHARPLTRFAPYSVEWLASLAQRATGGGQVILDVPLANLTAEAVVVIAATFEEAIGFSSMWSLIDEDDHPTLRLKGTPDMASLRHSDLKVGWFPISSLLDAEVIPPGLHSIRRDRITRTIKPKPQEESNNSLIEWLKSRRPSKAPTQSSQEP